MMNSKIMSKTAGKTRHHVEPRIIKYRNRLNGETVQVLANSKIKIIDGVEFMEVIVHGRKNLMRKEHLQPIS